MFTIAVVNQKGGSGKSTLAECLAVAAYLDDKGVGVLDIDPQGTAYKWARRRKDPNPVVKSVTPANYADEWQRLKDAGADLVIFDTPARLSDHTSAAIELADLIIIPTKTTMKDLERVGATYDLIQKSETRPDARTFVVINQTRPQGERSDQSVQYLTDRGFAVCPYSLGYRVAFEDADEDGQTPQETELRGKAAAEIQEVYQYTIKLLHHITSERVNHHGKELSRTFA
jgi:chromosome partitioning protein